MGSDNSPFVRHAVKADGLSQWTAGLGAALRAARGNARTAKQEGVALEFLEAAGALWMLYKVNPRLHLAARLFFDPGGFQKITVKKAAGRGRRGGNLSVTARGGAGEWTADLRAEGGETVLFRSVVSLKPVKALTLSLIPREVCLLDGKLEPLPEGSVYTAQTGPAAGQVFAGAEKSTVFYFQNLTALSPYFELTGTDLPGTVGVEWPELGLKPPVSKDKPLPAGRAMVLSDAFLRIRPDAPQSECELSVCFMDALCAIYRELDVPPAPWRDWPAAAARTVRDLSRSKECLRELNGVTYVNAYVSSSYKPPESMVQGAVLVPLLEYENWLGRPVKLARLLEKTPETFYDPKLKTIVRWLPGVEFEKEEVSEEEVAFRMDSWYLLHTLMNLGRLAELGRETERTLFLKCLDYVIRVARHFAYEWPVFYDQRTLRVFKEEKQPGQGGEQDVVGLYVHVMLQAWEITREDRFIQEAEASAAKLKGLTFGVLYQTNTTMFSAVGLARLWKVTGNSLYRDLSLVCVGSIVSHLWMHEARYGPGKAWSVFPGLPPLHDAPYIAPYEEAEVFAAIQAYLETLNGYTPESVTLLLSEYRRHLLHRARFYFPEELPPESVCQKPREGILRPELMIPLEDLYPSRQKAGQVGQEVYGAALALILATHAFHRRAGLPFTVFCGYPLMSLEFSRAPGGTARGEVRCRLGGAKDMECALRLIPDKNRRLESRLRFLSTPERPEVEEREITPVSTPEGHHEYTLPGGAEVLVEWESGPVSRKSS